MAKLTRQLTLRIEEQDSKTLDIVMDKISREEGHCTIQRAFHELFSVYRNGNKSVSPPAKIPDIEQKKEEKGIQESEQPEKNVSQDHGLTMSESYDIDFNSL